MQASETWIDDLYEQTRPKRSRAEERRAKLISREQARVIAAGVKAEERRQRELARRLRAQGEIMVQRLKPADDEPTPAEVEQDTRDQYRLERLRMEQYEIIGNLLRDLGGIPQLPEHTPCQYMTKILVGRPMTGT